MRTQLFIALMIMLICTGCRTISPTNTTSSISVQPTTKTPKNFLDDTCKGAVSIYDTREEYGYIPLTLAQRRAMQVPSVFVPMDITIQRIKKYELDKIIDISDTYGRNGLSKKNETSSNLWINLEITGRGVNGLDYRFLVNGRENDVSLSHQILPAERTEIINYINLVTDNPQESNKILDELLQRYHAKVANKETIDDINIRQQYNGGITYQLFVADLEKDGRLYELVGKERHIKDMPWCHFSNVADFYIR